MEKRINVAEILKDCPTGMELDCTMFYNAYLERVYENGEFPIVIKVGKTELQRLTEEGCWNKYSNAKCVIFPKGKTTWEGFHRPFKDGDILATKDGLFIGIVKESKYESFKTYCAINSAGSLAINLEYYFERFATEEEKQKLFQAIKDNGYRWNEETKTLEKLIKPKFKVGDKVRIKRASAIYVVSEIREDRYMLDDKDISLLFEMQDKWELVSDKFDITTLVPFESRVLVRDTQADIWKPAVFGCCIVIGKFVSYYVLGGTRWAYCIPYEGNQHLIGKTDNCDDFYKNWEE